MSDTLTTLEIPLCHECDTEKAVYFCHNCGSQFCLDHNSVDGDCRYCRGRMKAKGVPKQKPLTIY